ncbi:hypothetical protein Tter_2862 [Thermobaculum terrenum ATCC BAA-798]|uniref:Uncharacterized protein n=1 Tax=Thermobaculum terrenum (strain ATCC BAA-798 / CCMEE 7001 / YNP1) TaxID=525904 RepID=D1CJ24_THET1|nr:hypothetical protein [Thermobaculum terrenum]ACZ43744.1 hypothetical protein Tter_2862 [Thermobaculum terrenum ATCC BAA-798]
MFQQDPSAIRTLAAFVATAILSYTTGRLSTLASFLPTTGAQIEGGRR